MKSSQPSAAVIVKGVSKAHYSQAEINDRARSLYFQHFEYLPKEMGTQYRKASRCYAKCLEQASEEMGPAIEFDGGEMTPAVVVPEVQALIERLALLKASPRERAKLMHFRW